jgi:hypothetical protein
MECWITGVLDFFPSLHHSYTPLLQGCPNKAQRYLKGSKAVRFSGKNIIVLAVLAFLVVGNKGCLSPMALQVAGSAGAAAPVTFESSGSGKADGFWIARYDDVTAATLRAGQALSLELKEKIIEDDQTALHYVDRKDGNIKLLIERRTDTVTAMRIDVGWFGSVGLGQLLIRQVIFELYEAGAFLQDWRPD